MMRSKWETEKRSDNVAQTFHNNEGTKKRVFHCAKWIIRIEPREEDDCSPRVGASRFQRYRKRF